MPSQNLIIRCEIYKMTITDLKSKIHVEKMLKWLNNEEDSDVTILGKDDIKYHVHKIFLCMYSNVFAKMINGKEFVAGNNNEIRIDSYSEAIKIMLKFIYTGEQST